jgi:ubiquinone/menaquinone biosynthesis C-methylase UbiE
MRVGRRLLGDPHGHADDNSGGLIRNPRLYEYGAAIGFLGRRRHVYDGLVALSGIRPGDQVLDVGCGTGYFARRAARAVTPGGRVVGIDPSPPVIDYATRTAPSHCTFTLASAEQLPQPDASVDVVISSLAIHHLPPAQRPTALREMRRVLRPDGRLLIVDFRPPRRRPLVHRHGSLSPERLAGLITDAGFHLTATGNRWPRLHYVQAQRPATPTPITQEASVASN